MKFFLNILLFFIITFCAYGQKVINVPIDSSRSTAPHKLYAFSDNPILYLRLHLSNLETSTDSFHFRLCTEGRTIDIWTNDYKTFYGQSNIYFIRWARKHKSNNDDDDTQEYHIGRAVIDTSIAKEMYQLIVQYSILSVEQEKVDIEDEPDDGTVIYTLEVSTPQKYSLIFHIVDKNDQMQTFIDDVEKNIEPKIQFKNFHLPKGEYENGMVVK